MTYQPTDDDVERGAKALDPSAWEDEEFGMYDHIQAERRATARTVLAAVLPAHDKRVEQRVWAEAAALAEEMSRQPGQWYEVSAAYEVVAVRLRRRAEQIGADDE